MEYKHKIKIKAEHVSKAFETTNGKLQVVNDVSFEVYENEFLVILGPGRCGKTVLLNMICGLLKKDSGNILIDGKK